MIALDDDYVRSATGDLQTAYALHLTAEHLNITGIQVVQPGWYRLRTTDRGHIDLHRMLTNWRLQLNGDDAPIRGYCYNGPSGLMEALAAGQTWSGEGDPGGRWYRAVHGDVRRKEYLKG